MTKRLFYLIVSLIVLSVNVPAQTIQKIDALKYFDENKRWYNTFTEHWFWFSDIADADVRDSIAQWERIGDDLDRPSVGWAGTYASGGDTHGDYLRLSEDGGFVWLKVNKCQGGPMQIIRGTVQKTADGVHLVPDVVLGRMSHGAHQTNRFSMVGVTWYGTKYLIETESLPLFADYVSGLGEFNGYYLDILGSPFFYIMKGAVDEQPKTFQLPLVPDRYVRLLKMPVRGQITRIGRSLRQVDKDSDVWDNLVTRVHFKVTHAENLVKGLKLFYVGGEQGFSEDVTVKKVSGNLAVLEISRPIVKKNCLPSASWDCENPEHQKLRVGLVLSSNGF